MIDYVQKWSSRTEIAVETFIQWMGISKSKFYNWKKRYGKVNEHNSWIPRDHWLEDWEKKEVMKFWDDHFLDGYRRLTYMMLDAGVVAVSPSSVYRILKNAGVIGKSNKTETKKGTGFDQPLKAHEHWHIDVSYINISGTFYYLCSILDGFSRFIVHWEMRESMKEKEIEIILQRAKEKYPHTSPRIISDNGPQFLAKDFKEFIRVSGMTHVKTSPYYPQSNGKLERWHGTIKQECIRPKSPTSLEEARTCVEEFVDKYNGKRLHSSIGYISPKDKLEGRADEIIAERNQKLREAREKRRLNRQQMKKVS